jgi:hypothetical protein
MVKQRTVDVEKLMQSLVLELDALKDRVQNIIGTTTHGLTSGEWKESILRTMLRRYLPSQIGVGRGFVVDSMTSSGQIDILLYDVNAPLLYQDGDLVFVTPDAVLGIIEVKSSVHGEKKFNKKIKKFTKEVEWINSVIFEEPRGFRLTAPPPPKPIFSGFFVYDFSMRAEEGMTRAETILSYLNRNANGDIKKAINHLSLGSNIFIRLWKHKPESGGQIFIPAGGATYNRWHFCDYEGVAPGYFISNVVGWISPKSVSKNYQLWYPLDGVIHKTLATQPVEIMQQDDSSSD